MSTEYQLDDLQATNHMAQDLARVAKPPLTIAINGTLGAGKTQWIRFFAAHLGVPAGDVTSPTYVLHQQYHGLFRIHHFDFYRLESESQVWDLGVDELYEQNALILIEWASKFEGCLPNDRLTLDLYQNADGTRRAALSAVGAVAMQVLGKLTG